MKHPNLAIYLLYITRQILPFFIFKAVYNIHKYYKLYTKQIEVAFLIFA